MRQKTRTVLCKYCHFISRTGASTDLSVCRASWNWNKSFTNNERLTYDLTPKHQNGLLQFHIAFPPISCSFLICCILLYHSSPYLSWITQLWPKCVQDAEFSALFRPVPHLLLCSSIWGCPLVSAPTGPRPYALNRPCIPAKGRTEQVAKATSRDWLIPPFHGPTAWNLKHTILHPTQLCGEP